MSAKHSVVDFFKTKFCASFTLKDLSRASELLGISIHIYNDFNAMKLIQSIEIRHFLKNIGMDQWKSISAPMKRSYWSFYVLRRKLLCMYLVSMLFILFSTFRHARDRKLRSQWVYWHSIFKPIYRHTGRWSIGYSATSLEHTRQGFFTASRIPNYLDSLDFLTYTDPGNLLWIQQAFLLCSTMGSLFLESPASIESLIYQLYIATIRSLNGRSIDNFCWGGI